MFCSKCGKKINDDSKFCSNCGAPVTSNKTTVNSVHQTSSSEQYTQILEQQTHLFALLGIIFAFIFPLLGLIFSVIAIKNSENNGIATVGMIISIILLIVEFFLVIFILVN